MKTKKKTKRKKLFGYIGCFLLVALFVLEFSSIKASATNILLQKKEINNDINILSGLGEINKKMQGITYTGQNGKVNISGTPTASSYVNLLGSTNEIPDELKSGDLLHLSFSSGTNYVVLGIRAFSPENPDGEWLIKTSKDTEFEVPDLTRYTGVAVRILTVQCNRKFDMDLYPQITVVNRQETEEINLLSDIDGLYKEMYGTVYSCNDGAVHITGTPLKSSYINLFGDIDEVPKELEEGDVLHFKFSSGTNYVTIGLRAFNPENPDGVWLIKTAKDADLVLPDLSGYTGIAIRILTVQTNREFDLKVSPKVILEKGEKENTENLLSNIDGMVKSVKGITYTCKKDEVNIKGTPTASSFINLLGSENEIPDELKEGERLRILFNSGTKYVLLGIKAFNESNPDGIWLLKTSVNADFVVPDLSEYTGVVIRIHTVKTDREFDLDTKPVIIKNPINKKFLTIIDDDGDIHYKTDIIPLITELKVPISSAVTPTRIGQAARWMTWEDITFCKENGGEILCHMYNHYTGTQMQTVSSETLLSEFHLAYNEFLSKGFDSGKYLVYSSSTGNMTRVQEVAAEVFSCGIKIGGNIVNSQETNPYSLSRFRIDYAETEGREDWNYDDMVSYVDKIVQEDGWGIWMIHTSNSKYRQRVLADSNGNIVYDEDGNPVLMVDENGNPILDVDGSFPTVGKTVFLPMLERAIAYAQSRGVEIVTVDQGYETYFKK